MNLVTFSLGSLTTRANDLWSKVAKNASFTRRHLKPIMVPSLTEESEYRSLASFQKVSSGSVLLIFLRDQICA